MDYKSSGVDLTKGDAVKQQITKLIAQTYTDTVLTTGGEFAGAIRINDAGDSIVVSIDGVGTKVKLAIDAGRHDTVGHDLVNHCVNDIAVVGADPLCFVDYLGLGSMDPEVTVALVEGLVAGCRENGVALVGGETAQMPGIYSPGEYDLAGAIVGRLTDGQMLPRHGFAAGDALVGVASNGLHTNGYSLARAIVFESMGWKLSDYVEELQATWEDELLRIHRSYMPFIRLWRSVDGVRGFAHITGGGIPGNLSRIIPDDFTAVIETERIPRQPVFDVLRDAGQVTQEEMYNVFNMGVGLVVVCSPETADSIVKSVDGSFTCWIAGRIETRGGDSAPVVLQTVS